MTNQEVIEEWYHETLVPGLQDPELLTEAIGLIGISLADDMSAEKAVAVAALHLVESVVTGGETRAKNRTDALFRNELGIQNPERN